MAKDYEKLKEISVYFTEEKLKEILLNKHKGKEVNVLEWVIDQANATGDNYLSIIYEVKVIGTVDGKDAEVDLIVKSIPKNKGRTVTFRSADFFRNEIVFYTKVIAKYHEFVASKGHNKLLPVPHHLASACDGENDFLALEDLSTLGYKQLKRQFYVAKDDMLTMLKSAAKFHAVSFAFKDQKPEEYNELVNSVEETYFSDKYWDWYKKFHNRSLNIGKNALELEVPNSEVQKKFNSYKHGDLYNICSEFCNRKFAPTSVATQGDCWTPNFMCTDQNECIMLDFQLARFSSPVLDLGMCIYCCTGKEMWDNSGFDNMLKQYYSELASTISLLGSDPEKLYSWDTFMSEVKEQFVFGMTFALEAIPFILLDESEAFDLDVINNDAGVNIDDVWTVGNIKTQEGRQRLVNVIAHAVEHGFLK